MNLNSGSGPNTHWGKVSLALCAGLFVSMQVGKLGPAIPVLRDDLGLSLVGAGYALSIFTLLAIFSGGSAGRLARFSRPVSLFWDLIRDDWYPWVR